MARKKNEPVDLPVDDQLSPDAVSGIVESAQQAIEHSEQVLAQYGDGLPYHRRLYIDKARSHMARSAEEMLAAGRCLIVLKEHEPHGEWLHVLDELSLDHTLAKRMMQAAVKFSNGATSHHLIEAAGNKSKLFELMALDNEELEALNEGGTVMGLTLDDIDRMPVSELRKTLRDAKEQDQAKDRLLADKSAQIDRLATDLTRAQKRIRTLTTEEADKELRQQAALVAYEAEVAVAGNLREVCNTMLEHAEQSGADYRPFLANMIRHLETQLAALRDEFALPEADGAEAFAFLAELPEG